MVPELTIIIKPECNKALTISFSEHIHDLSSILSPILHEEKFVLRNVSPLSK
jgi:hypothetical protein